MYASKVQDGSTDTQAKPTSVAELHSRLQALEKMIASLAQPGSEQGMGMVKPTDLDQDKRKLSAAASRKPLVSSVGGRNKTDMTESEYLGATNWTTILENVGTRELYQDKIILISCRSETCKHMLNLLRR